MAHPETARDDDMRQKAAALREKLKKDAVAARREVEQARVAEARKTMRLRALRLAREAAEKTPDGEA
ncbi:MAG: hypothetical protein J4F33_05720 [Alphaproteobacteria bacterium]|nr:hypothetical protein [Alphaproteobacteria bacterium]